MKKSVSFLEGDAFSVLGVKELVKFAVLYVVSLIKKPHLLLINRTV